MQITQPYREYTARTQFNPSRMRGFYLDLREKLYMGTLKGHRKLPDSLAPKYKARLATLAAQRFMLHFAVRVLYLMLIAGLLAMAVGCSSSAPTAPSYKPFVPCAVGYIRGGPDNSTCVLGTP